MGDKIAEVKTVFTPAAVSLRLESSLVACRPQRPEPVTFTVVVEAVGSQAERLPNRVEGSLPPKCGLEAPQTGPERVKTAESIVEGVQVITLERVDFVFQEAIR